MKDDVSGISDFVLIEVNLVQACLGNITDAHQAIIYTYDNSKKLCSIITYLSYSNEEIAESAQEISDELWVRVTPEIDVVWNVVVGHQGVLNLLPGEHIHFLRKGFEILTSKL